MILHGLDVSEMSNQDLCRIVMNMIVERKEVPEDVMYRVALSILNGELDDVYVAGLLVGLRVKGESESEIIGFVRAMLDSCVKIDVDGLDPIDTAGTGGDGYRTINVSTISGLLASYVDGVYVLKHGNRSVSSSSGSADFLEKLGFNIYLNPEQALRLLKSTKFSFLFAPIYHPLMRNVMHIRKKLGIRTIFNIVGPLSNPGNVKRQVIGVSNREIMYKICNALNRLGKKKVLVIHGDPGIDEISVFGRTYIVELDNGKIEEYSIDVEDLGLNKWKIEDVMVRDSEESVRKFLKALEEKRGPIYEFILANTAAALYVADVVNDLKDGVELAKEITYEDDLIKHIYNIVDMSRKV